MLPNWRKLLPHRHEVPGSTPKEPQVQSEAEQLDQVLSSIALGIAQDQENCVALIDLSSKSKEFPAPVPTSLEVQADIPSGAHVSLPLLLHIMVQGTVDRKMRLCRIDRSNLQGTMELLALFGELITPQTTVEIPEALIHVEDATKIQSVFESLPGRKIRQSFWAEGPDILKPSQLLGIFGGVVKFIPLDEAEKPNNLQNLQTTLADNGYANYDPGSLVAMLLQEQLN